MKIPARFRIGNQTNCNVPAHLPFKFAIDNGFDAFEWFSDPGRVGWHEDTMSAAQRSECRAVALKHDILFSVHAPWAADPTKPAGAAAIMQSIRFAGEVGAGIVNLHIFPQYEAKVYVEALMPLIEAARPSGLRLSIENTRQTSPEAVNDIFAVISARQDAAGHVGMCLDMGHANLFAGTHNDYLSYVDQLGEQVPIIHWHAHENWGDSDSHLPLFTGSAAQSDAAVRALVQILKRRGFVGSVVMEQWPEPPEILVETRRRLLEIWSETKV
ncbi:MAG: hypothetical protein CVV41_22065 [Candidatus Riflebacteria bacterium HGW-Riflebacteria-1]|jgi:sugar phosphate isomerase/epimerase|nr:MAG: hypothetical protein CVV41_22065 [Candidatus Riflebacteria bacterium HGW-Riflebacteria-1]